MDLRGTPFSATCVANVEGDMYEVYLPSLAFPARPATLAVLSHGQVLSYVLSMQLLRQRWLVELASALFGRHGC
jgi:hypothetical protein